MQNCCLWCCQSNFSQQTWRSYVLLVSVKSNYCCWRSYVRQDVARYSRSYSKKQRVTVTHYLLSSTGYDDVTLTSSPRPNFCLWFGAQTAHTDSDWLKQLKLFTAGAMCFGWNKTVSKLFRNSSETVLKLFWNSFVSVSFQLCRLFKCISKKFWRFI